MCFDSTSRPLGVSRYKREHTNVWQCLFVYFLMNVWHNIITIFKVILPSHF